jgi:hypothetical protein
MLPTDDFVWLDMGGIEVELKSPRVATADAATRLIRTSILKGVAQGVVKENFVVGDKLTEVTLE